MEKVLPQTTWDICQKGLNKERNMYLLSYLNRPTVRFYKLQGSGREFRE